MFLIVKNIWLILKEVVVVVVVVGVEEEEEEEEEEEVEVVVVVVAATAVAVANRKKFDFWFLVVWIKYRYGNTWKIALDLRPLSQSKQTTLCIYYCVWAVYKLKFTLQKITKQRYVYNWQK